MPDTSSSSDVPLPSKNEYLKRFGGILPESQGQNLALTVLHVPYSLDIGQAHVSRFWVSRFRISSLCLILSLILSLSLSLSLS